MATGVIIQIPRNTLALLMVAQVAVVVPLAAHISLWIVGVCLFCGFWRTQVYRGRWGYPPSWVKTLLVIASFVGIAASGYRSFTLEAATSLLVLAFALKLVEMKTRRDAYLVIYLSYFLVATAFLFNQTIALAAYELVAVFVVTAALVGLNQLQSRVRPLASLWTASALVLQAIPLTLVLFMLFPRIGPLWSIPMPSASATGLSDRLTPGDVASLSKSDELAFRAVFEGAPPLQRDMYWRGLTYSDFAYGTWAVGEPLPGRPKSASGTAAVTYEIFLEPTQSRWLYSLDVPVDYGPRMELLGDHRLLNREPVLSVLRYAVHSDPDRVLDKQLDPEIFTRETVLPPGDNPRIRGYATDLLDRAGTPRNVIQLMLEEIRSKSYRYTLNPPRLPRLNSIDEFWFETQAGFCTHYAGAMVFALRSLGVPARVVGGYQGGEINPVTGHVVVRQYQAHAWVEVWFPEDGWVRYDPTAAVAPERVEDGLNAALSSDDLAALSLFTTARMSGEGTLRKLLDWADSVEYQWNLWVVGYDAVTQGSVLEDLLGGITPARIGMAIGIGGGVSLLLVCISLFWRRPTKRHPVQKILLHFCAHMAKRGYSRAPAETPDAYVERLCRIGNLESAEVRAELQRLYYDPNAAVSWQELGRLRAELRKIRFKLAFASHSTAS